jgi:alpha-glucosidase
MFESVGLTSSVPKGLGEIRTYHLIEQGIEGNAQNGCFRVQFYSNKICRVQLSKESYLEDFSYSVIAKPETSEFNLVDSEKGLFIKTSSIQLAINRPLLSFTFLTLSGDVVNKDEDGLTTSWIGEQVTCYKKMQEGERFVGLGEKTGSLDRRGSGYQNWTTDSYGYHAGQDPLYCSTPFYIGIHSGLVYGIFFDNSHKTFFNFGASNNRFSSFSADAGEMNYYFISGSTVAEVIQSYTFLTGTIELPPLWSLGYQQCRYSYYPDKEVNSLARTFIEKDIPADTIVLDIHYMDKYKIFTWDKDNFADPKAMLAELRSQGFHVVVMCDPGIKIEEGYLPYDEGVAKDVFIKYPDGSNYSGQVWPGWCHFPDFTNPAARQWWGDQFKQYTDLGIEGFWNDMNEIATWGQMLPENMIFDFEGNKATTRRGRNLFGFLMARSTYEGAKKNLQGKRPFNLTRSGFSGVQRYGAVWTGDNVSYDEHMLLGVRIVNSMGLTGIAFAGYDIGGFVGEASTKLFARWIAIGTFSPFFRGHTMINTRDHEPWSFGEEVEQIARNFIKLRYKLLPYIYSLFHEASIAGTPIQRSLAINYTHDPKIYNHQFHNQYLFGPNILIAPVESTKEITKVYLPDVDWYCFYTGTRYAGNQELFVECPIHRLPIFVKAGSILPTQLALSNTSQKSHISITHIYFGGKSTFVHYEDDGETYRHETGDYFKRKISYNPEENKILFEQAEGNFNPSYKDLKIVLHSFPHTSATINNRNLLLEQEMHSFFSPLEKYDPFSEPESMGEENVKSINVKFTTSQIEILLH